MRSPPPPPPLLISLPLLQAYLQVNKRIHPVIGLIRLRDLVTLHNAVFMFQFHHNLLPRAVLTTSFHLYHLSIGTVLGYHQSQLIKLIRLELITVNLIYTSLVLLLGIILSTYSASKIWLTLINVNFVVTWYRFVLCCSILFLLIYLFAFHYYYFFS